MPIKLHSHMLSLIARWWSRQNKKADGFWEAVPLIIVTIFATSTVTYIVLSLVTLHSA